MVVAETFLPLGSSLGLHPERRGPVRALEFEGWMQNEDNPRELLGGWVVPMSPGNHRTGRAFVKLAAALDPLVVERRWELLFDARHRFPNPPDTVLFPDLALHCVSEVPLPAGSETVHRVPDLVIELLGAETAERDVAPQGAKFLAYQLSGVREYHYAWPDGPGAASFQLVDGVYRRLEPDAEGFVESPVLGVRLRLAPAAVRR
ncbi:MAG: Uma2 family endonuclease [Thermoanaerobaculia bacterium]|nr:Uma2 family endonuclease [Thermoanaerobaculia bacterium]